MTRLTKDGRRTHDGARRRFSYSNVVATLALVIAVGGGTAWAAKHVHYKISSASQIKPSVLKKLRGASGTDGTDGSNGAQGVPGATGATGAAGAAGAVAGLSATFTGSATIPIAGNTGNFVTVVSKTLPAGHYIVNAAAETSASADAGANTNPGVETECDLFSGATSVDTSQATVPLSQVTFIAAFDQAGATLPLSAALNLNASTTISVQCQLKLPLSAQQPSGFAASATNGVIAAVQTTTNG